MAFDVIRLQSDVEDLQDRMIVQEAKTEYLAKEINTIKIMQGVSLVFSLLGSAGSTAYTGLVLSAHGLQFPQQLGGVIREVWLPAHLRGPNTPHYALFALPQNRSLLEGADIKTLTTWTNEEYKNFHSVICIENDEEILDDEAICSVSTALEIGNRFRDSLKPAFQIIINEITEMKNNKGILDNILAEYATIDDVNNVLKEYAQLTHLEENYLTKGQIEETYCNFDELTELFYDKKDTDAKFNEYYTNN